MKKILAFITILLILVISITACNTTKVGLTNNTNTASTTNANNTPANKAGNKLNIYYLNVGQADSILINTPDNKSMLIDAGNREDGNFIVNYIKKLGIQKLDVVIATHPHEDHIGAMAQIIKTFDIGSFYMPKVTTNTKTFENMLRTLQQNNIRAIYAKGGMKIQLGKGVDIDLLAPNRSKYDDLNDYSAVVRLTYGKKAFLFEGDAGKPSEYEMLQRGYDLKADVLKVGHHGSITSTGNKFLEMVNPKYAIIMVGKNNDYGLPNKETIDKLNAKGIKIFRTDKDGTIHIVTNGQIIDVYTKQ
ncbi:ComEC/Rec2 family competence protein [Thermoanaerobacterium sp. RBIITD]|uniref:ComEC/Rec2 family competence protein n=1 Tax=Thermoanaerobacterium sp. RBIITD TaxID=1550240 RepID=UPI001E3AD7BD|nr:ComEC/Rec2 family competence protein [Thermoanaerobacterium sp. RBIITD]